MWRLFLETWAEGLAFVIGIATFRRLPIAYKFVVVQLGFAMICEVGGYCVGMIGGHANAWIFNIYMLVEQWVLTIAAMLMVDKGWRRQTMAALLLVGTTVWIADIRTNSIVIFANFSMVTCSIVLTICYLIVLFAKDIMTSVHILRNPDFWLCVAILVYFSADIPFMGLRNYLFSSYPKVADELVNINRLLVKIRYPMTAVSFLLQARLYNTSPEKAAKQEYPESE
jgi:hypothetical protein